jgi:pyruvate ferredoxin oxidoreductase alpha subunit
MALAGAKVRVMTAIAGLGGRPITKASLRELFNRAERSTLEGITFMDLNAQMIQNYLARQNHRRRATVLTAEPNMAEIAAQVS